MECSICLQSILPVHKIFTCTHCTQSFHNICIEEWVNSRRSNRKCPLCRSSISETEDRLLPSGTVNYSSIEHIMIEIDNIYEFPSPPSIPRPIRFPISSWSVSRSPIAVFADIDPFINTSSSRSQVESIEAEFSEEDQNIMANLLAS